MRRFYAMLMVLPLLFACNQKTDAAPEATSASVNLGDVKKNFEQAFVGREVLSAHLTPVEGVYELFIKADGGYNLLYSSANARYLLVGDMVNATTKQSISDRRKADLLASAGVAKEVDKVVVEPRLLGENAASITKKFQQQFGDYPVLGVKETPLSGIYELTIKNNGSPSLVYTDAAVHYLFFAELIDTVNRTNLTQLSREKLSQFDFTKLPFEKAIKEVRGNGKRQLAVFSDPDCPYCKQLERDSLAKMTDITIYTFLMPLKGLHPDATRKSIAIWCSADKTAAWTNWMRNNKAPSAKVDCANPVQQTVDLGAAMGIRGTPALLFPSGRMEAGALPVEAIESLLKQGKQ
jgi:thiol:disulfide interchange protein DsbC